MVFILYKLYVLLPYTYPTPKLSPHRRRCISTFPPKISLCMIYKRFKLWGHWKCPHKSPSPCNTYVIPMSLYKFAVENHWNGASFLHSLIGNEKRRGTIYSVLFWIQRWKSNGSHARICTAVTHIADRWWCSGGQVVIWWVETERAVLTRADGAATLPSFGLLQKKLQVHLQVLTEDASVWTLGYLNVWWQNKSLYMCVYYPSSHRQTPAAASAGQTEQTLPYRLKQACFIFLIVFIASL